MMWLIIQMQPIWKQNWTVVTDWTGCDMWLKQDRTTTWSMRFMMEIILNSHDLSDRVQSLMKTREDKDVTDRIGVVYTKKWY